jgi:hypothetical protein
MLRRRELLLGMGEAALEACAPGLRDPAEILIARGNGLLCSSCRSNPRAPSEALAGARGQVTMAPDFDAPLDDFLIDIDNDVSKCAAAGPPGARGGAAG